MKRYLSTALVIVVAASLTAAATATAGKQRSRPSPDEIIDNMIEQDPLGFGGAEARLVMALVNNRKQTRKRKLVMLSRTDGDTRRSFVRFTDPADIAGTSFLGVDDDGDRTQYLHLPSLDKTRRISGSQRNASFVGTDYSYSDLDLRDVEDSSKKLLGEDEVGGHDTWVVQARPSDEASEYDEIHVWVDKQTWLPLRMRFFDGKRREVKRLTVQEVKKVKDQWVIFESKMVDLKREHTTVIKVIEIKLRKDIPLDQFSVRALDRQ